ncbi:Ribulose-phosphate 3-epimerase [Coriobacterium glomerans PW2]|uniref:Ribulose-phosphate 3-epimerase n=1 Tax=Coriobacterium glomerans (strain ATCC 49209 / DSM 20642 / JCM 10262 / PW2) TaxID=700015 RepID=F2N8F0_CORGP|nr:ribulose-phosphate 3-epimerase [Coriobacterium glomerans]AEB07333.1 Ribulose-phosphate 3-epimerase [Coriobacterium glomerans PW2]
MKQEFNIYPSIMCSAPWDVKGYIDAFERAGVAGVHFDVMDGHYVPNVMLGTDDFDAIASITELSLDVHIMAEGADAFVSFFKLRPHDRCCFHPETCAQPYRLLERIRRRASACGLALSPGTPVGYVTECLELLDFVLVMAVSPGFAGQTMVADHLNKVKRIRELVRRADHPIEIVIDGNTTVANARRMIEAGANGFVVGTSSLMGEGPAGFATLYEAYLTGLAS